MSVSCQQLQHLEAARCLSSLPLLDIPTTLPPPSPSHSISRLHREALKQSATDPKTGIIDVSILTTGVSSSERSRRQQLARELKRLLQSKAKGGAQLKTTAIFDVVREQSQVVSVRGCWLLATVVGQR